MVSARDEEDGTILVFMLKRFGPRGEARRWPLALGLVSEDNRHTKHDTGALSLGVECRSQISWHAFVPLREKHHFVRICMCE